MVLQKTMDESQIGKPTDNIIPLLDAVLESIPEHHTEKVLHKCKLLL